MKTEEVEFKKDKDSEEASDNEDEMGAVE